MDHYIIIVIVVYKDNIFIKKHALLLVQMDIIVIRHHQFVINAKLAVNITFLF